jgi:hypothetical protein
MQPLRFILQAFDPEYGHPAFETMLVVEQPEECAPCSVRLPTKIRTCRCTTRWIRPTSLPSIGPSACPSIRKEVHELPPDRIGHLNRHIVGDIEIARCRGG